ncbi:tripartite tricarboxylate transporter substrate binding protein [Corticibacter populi]|uniref:Tripartite tricarboxylate transporter substrate binding protein n=1 Tax=Corticibacter populi TaxID=1550736 RepID=A0A3M6QVD1_9BURK|nr:tripartite tricarboxylate transporter substrate binding protein [Corticibacter populi]RMX06943.1 tripartite tricarboxylate transporter substrate binding protein [Corticibacter populi]RZS31538.1 tripartite-type tricarboxylate transporter receptor subunit TctC [Corticibacter populi]
MVKVRGVYRRHLLLLLAAAALAPLTVAAQSDYPSRPISLIVPFPPGGQTDAIGRLVGDRLSKALNQTVVVENKPGVNGSLGSDFVARAKPDGYTLIIGGPGSHAINQLVNKNVKYDTRKDFTHIAMISRGPMLLLAAPTLNEKTLADVVNMAKANPDSLNMALTGIGSSGHMTTELLKQSAGISFNAVPYKGDSPAMADLTGGHADLLFVPATSAIPFVQSGKLHALAVTSESRLPALPDVPTMAEAGQPQVVNYSWANLAGPAGLPDDIVQRLNDATQGILAEADFVERLATMSNEPTPGTSQQARDFVAAEVARWIDVVEKANIEVQ